ncbi:MAG: glycosyltransferase family 2 protein [Firmicutes bacterium]|nr:glycosyltransferase family 2 protein [Bacillota bacterium]
MLQRYKKIEYHYTRQLVYVTDETEDDESIVYFDVEEDNEKNEYPMYLDISCYTFDDEGNIFPLQDFVDEKTAERDKITLSECEQYLADTDYLSIKHFEGLIDNGEFQAVKHNRAACRKKINEIEKKLNVFKPVVLSPTLSKEEWIAADNVKNYPHELVIQCIARREEPYFKEWIEHHLNLGIDHIYIYDNNDEDTLPAFLKTVLSEAHLAKVSVFPWRTYYKFQQVEAAYHFAKNYRDTARWVMNIDLDEFFMLDIPLKAFLQEFSAAGQVYFSWECLDANGQVYYEDKPSMQRFTRRYISSDIMQGKSMFRPSLLKPNGFNLHGSRLLYEDLTVNVHHKKLDIVPDSNAHIYEVAWVKHFFTRSLEEWEWKIKRGCADVVFLRKYDMFFDINPDLREHKRTDFQIWQGHGGAGFASEHPAFKRKRKGLTQKTE